MYRHEGVCEGRIGWLAIQQVLDATTLGFTTPRCSTRFIIQLPEVCKFERLWQDALVVARHVLLFVIAHEHSTAIVLFILAIVLGFPIEMFLSIVVFIPQALLLATLVCIDLGTGRVREDRLAPPYQSRMFGGFTPAGNYVSSGQSSVTVGSMQVPAKHPLSVFVGWMCMAAFLTLLVDHLHQGQILKAILDAIPISSPER